MFTIGMGQITIEPGNPRKNFQVIQQAVAYATSLNVDILVLPELCLSGYLIGDRWEQPAFIAECLQFGEQIRNLSKDMAIVFGNVGVDETERNFDGRPRTFNALYCAHHGEWISPDESPYPFTIKTLSPNYRFFAEDRYFFNLPMLAGERGKDVASFCGPITLHFEDKGSFTFGPLICEDSWIDNYTENPALYMMENARQTGKTIDTFINISASPFTLGKQERRHRLLAGQALALNTPFVYVNGVSIQNNGKSICSFDGSSCVYDETGAVTLELPFFESTIRTTKLPKRMETDILAKELPATIPTRTPTKETIATIYDALSFTLRSYFKQYHLSKVVIGVSGGIDSAVNAALYASILPPEQVYLVTMPSRYNSQETQSMAAQLASNLGCPFASIPIEDSVRLTEQQLSHVQFKMAHQPDVSIPLEISSFVMENVQARDRSSRILAAIAAAVGGVFTCNGNKTELSVGYATMYGDLSGFIASLGDLWKHQVYELAHYLNDIVYGKPVIPPETIAVKPSAELSPAQDITKGLGDPLQYEYHDRLLQSFIEPWQRWTPEDVLRAYMQGNLEEKLQLPHPISHYFPTVQAFIEDLERWWRLQAGFAVAKRIQAPPVIVVSRRAYGGDLQESFLPPYLTEAYEAMKQQLLQQLPGTTTLLN